MCLACILLDCNGVMNDLADLKEKFVRITAVKDDKYVEFNFSIGDAEIFVELILPLEMFHAFCKTNDVRILPSDKNIRDRYQRSLWRGGYMQENIFGN